MNKQYFKISILLEDLSLIDKQKLWKKILKYTFKQAQKQLDKIQGKRKRKKIVDKAYDDASKKYHKELDRLDK